MQPFVAQGNETADGPAHLTPAEADEIFTLAEAEIEPLLKKMRRERWTGWLQGFLCVSLLLFSLAGVVWQCITFPHTLVVLYAKEKPASVTTTLDLHTRTLAPVTITRNATTQTTGHGHQDARAATGTLIFYNGSSTPQMVPVGSVFTGNDGVKVTTAQSITVPAANLPAIGSMPVLASALLPGSHGNIAAFDVDIALSSVLKVRNETPFTNGHDARDYTAVAKRDLSSLTTTVNQTVTQAFTTAFPIRHDEAAIPTTCHTLTTPTHQVGVEAQSVTLTIVKTCLAVVYNSQQLGRLATAAFTATRPGAQYRIIGQVQISIVTVSPLTVHLTGAWAVVFTQNEEQLLAEKIAGDTPDQARKTLVRTGVIAYASIPNTLPPAIYITFIVLVGK